MKVGEQLVFGYVIIIIHHLANDTRGGIRPTLRIKK